jgi:nitric oxide reductase NorD protein
MTDDPDRGPGATLARLAAALEATSPGFAARLRDVAPTLASLPDDLASAFLACLERLLALEGPGREATQALIATNARDLEAIGMEALEQYRDAFERVARCSLRSASTFAAAVLPELARAPTARGDSLARAAGAIEELGRRHGADPILQRFAGRAGEVLASRDGHLVEAWAELCEVTRFGGRRPADVLDPIVAPPGLEDETLTAVVRIAARVGERDRLRAVRLFRAGPEVLAEVPRAHRPAALGLLQELSRSPEACLDSLDVLGPVIRRVPVGARASVLELGRRIAERHPAAASPYLRRVLRVGETVGFASGLTEFVAKGLSLLDGDESGPDAARAFFALESRTALAFLSSRDTGVSFEEVEHTLRGYLRLVAPGGPSPEGIDSGGLFPVIRPEAETLPVGRRTALFPTWEENFSLVKLQVTLASLWDEQGTLGFELGRWLGSDATGGLSELYRTFRSPDAAAGLFAHVEAARLMPSLARRFPGLAADVRLLRRRLFPDDRVAAGLGAPGAILFLAMGGAPERIEDGGRASGALLELAAAARRGEATVYDSATVTSWLCERFEEGTLVRVYGIEDFFEDDPYMAYVLEEGDERPGPGAVSDRPQPSEEGRAGSGHRVDDSAEGAPADAALLRAYLEQNPDVAVLRSEGTLDPTGLFVAGLTGGANRPTDPKRSAAGADSTLVLARPGRRSEEVFLQDEWDHRIADYRPGWCRVHEVPVHGTDAAFFTSTLARYAEMLPEVRRHFQRVKPEGYRIVHGLLDGEDFDLNAVVTARSDLRARKEPSAKLYTARKREERDVATVFLLDMSASTDEEAEASPAELADDPWEAARAPAVRHRGRRIIDIQKEALVIMAQSLEEIGDLYAIYGFSGHGRDQVEFFVVKSFDEPLSLTVRSRIGAIEPQRSTRMGAAIRQAIAKLRVQPSRARHLLLLSDGFPQDFDYGEDRRSNLYGLRDTAMALKEAQRVGIVPFCITVDRAGNDYLREMCDEKSYLVIDDIRALPRELPKIYSETTRAG